MRGNTLVDGRNDPFLLTGVVMSGLSYAQPDGRERLALEAISRHTFRVLRQRWNSNAVRLAVNPRIWTRDGAPYMDRIGAAVRLANEEGLVAILAAAPDETGLPDSGYEAFWTAAAQYFRDTEMLIFSLYSRPSARFLPGAAAGVRGTADWEFWRNGGTAANGRRVLGMQQLVNTVRAAGARQILSVAAFDDPLGFQGFPAALEISGGNILYELYPYFRPADAGALAGRQPLYAGEWGAPFHEDSLRCASIPPTPPAAGAALFQLLFDFLDRSMSWTAAEFEPGQLIRDFEEFEPSTLEQWTCGQRMDPQPGIGSLLLQWMTGDTFGFGSVAPEQIANSAGGPAGPAAPGEILSLYGQGMGPDVQVLGSFDETGSMTRSLAGTEVRFDGVAAPVFAAGSFEVKVQVPYEVEGRARVEVQAFYRGVPSNRIRIPVVDAAPELFARPLNIREALAADGDGNANGQSNPASAGSLLVLFASGCGATEPVGLTGVPAAEPLPRPRLPVSVTVGGVEAPVEYISQAPGLVGVTQIHIRTPQIAGDGVRSVPVTIRVGESRGRAEVRIWVR